MEQEYLCMALVTVLLLTMQLHLSVSHADLGHPTTHSAFHAPSVLICPELQREALSGRESQTTLPARGRNWLSFMWDQSHPIKQNSQEFSNTFFALQASAANLSYMCVCAKDVVLGRRPEGLCWGSASAGSVCSGQSSERVGPLFLPAENLGQVVVGWPPWGGTHRKNNTKTCF